MRNRRNGGQALVELGIIVTLLIAITLGAVEFGYAFFALHTVTQATAAGARAASVLQVGNRDACGRITDTSAIDSLVRSQVGRVVTVAPGASGVSVVQSNSDGTPITGDGVTVPCSASNMPKVRVTVNATVPYIFGLLGSSAFNFTRTETFRDEGR
jgi:Flp pilus assembly protein TadG